MDRTTQAASWRRYLLGALAAMLFSVPASVPAFSDWDNEQDLEIDSNGFNQVLFLDFESGETRVSGVNFGDSEVTYFLNESEAANDYDFVGAFLFDYSDGEFTADFYAAASDEFGSSQ